MPTLKKTIQSEANQEAGPKLEQQKKELVVDIPNRNQLMVGRKVSESPRKMCKKSASQRQIVKRSSFNCLKISIQEYQNIKKKTKMEMGEKFPELSKFKGRLKNTRAMIRVNSFSNKNQREKLEIKNEEIVSRSPQNNKMLNKSNSICYNNQSRFFDLILESCNVEKEQDKSSESISDNAWDFPSSPKSMHLSQYL